jgi:NAD(P)H dehydrogenase (quinone)
MLEISSYESKRALLSVTTGGASSHYERGGWNGDIHSILRPIQRGIFQFTGFSVLSPHTVHGPAQHDQAGRVKELERYTARLQQIEQEEPYDVGSY